MNPRITRLDYSNALIYTPDDNLLLAMRAQNWILKIDYENGTGPGNILWKLGDGADFTHLGGDPSQWFCGQHDPNLLSTNGSEMTLAIYDNGNFRIDSDGVACTSCYSRVTIFQVDENTHLATPLWQDLPGYFSNSVQPDHGRRDPGHLPGLTSPLARHDGYQFSGSSRCIVLTRMIACHACRRKSAVLNTVSLRLRIAIICSGVCRG
jgi:hypothetical protein